MDQRNDNYKRGRGQPHSYNKGGDNYQNQQEYEYPRPGQGFQMPMPQQHRSPYSQQQPIGQQPQSLGMNAIIMNPAHLQTNPKVPLHFGRDPQNVTCPYCHTYIATSVETKANSKTHLSALLLCCICPLGCCLVPYCMDSCQSQEHYCPNCQVFLGINKN